jgi:hypothetical protein
MSEQAHSNIKKISFMLIFCSWALIAAVPGPSLVAPVPVALPKDAVKLTASLLPQTAKVGDTVTLNLAFTLPKGCRLPEKPEIEGVDNLSLTDVKPYPGGLKLNFIADSIESIAIGPVKLSYLNDRGEKHIASSDALILKVTSNMESSPDKQQLRPIQDIIPAYPLWLPWALWALLGMVVLMCAAGIIFWLKRRAARRAQAIAALPPDIRARNELENLDASMLFEKGRIKEYYFRFSEILKRYLEDLRSFPAAEYTTEEISQHVALDIDRELVTILRRADIVKFADDVPSNSRKADDMKSALQYIYNTSPASGTLSKEVKQP